jgi:hypothetical protein
LSGELSCVAIRQRWRRAARGRWLRALRQSRFGVAAGHSHIRTSSPSRTARAISAINAPGGDAPKQREPDRCRNPNALTVVQIEGTRVLRRYEAWNAWGWSCRGPEAPPRNDEGPAPFGTRCSTSRAHATARPQKRRRPSSFRNQASFVFAGVTYRHPAGVARGRNAGCIPRYHWGLSGGWSPDFGLAS